MPVIRIRRPGTSRGAALRRLALARASTGAGRRQALLDRVEPPPDGAQLLAELAQVVARGWTPLVDRAPHALAHRAGARLRALDQLVDGLLGPRPGRLGGLPRRVERPLDRLSDGVGETRRRALSVCHGSAGQSPTDVARHLTCRRPWRAREASRFT